VRLKIDEQLPVEVAALLRGSGHDAATVGDEQLSGAADSKLADVCVRERRVMLTLDLGFSDIRTYQPAEHAGIIVLRPARRDKASVLALVARLLRALEERTVAGALWIVEEQRIRIRE